MSGICPLTCGYPACTGLGAGALSAERELRRERGKVRDATTSLLATLWQVQATSVGLVLALVTFVFGLLPGGRGRLTYREFLRRTRALRFTTFNVASLLFIGMVLLGIGRQAPPTRRRPGWPRRPGTSRWTWRTPAAGPGP
jgi:hypothetical protein